MEGMVCESCGHDWLAKSEIDLRSCPRCNSPKVRSEKAPKRVWPGVVVLIVAGAVIYFVLNPKNLPTSVDDVGAAMTKVQDSIQKAVGLKTRPKKPASTQATTFDYTVDWPPNPALAAADVPTMTRDANRAMAAEEYATAESLLKEIVLRAPQDINPWVTLALVTTKTGHRDDFNQVMLKLRTVNKAVFKSTLGNNVVPPDWRGFFRESTGSGSASGPAS